MYACQWVNAIVEYVGQITYDDVVACLRVGDDDIPEIDVYEKMFRRFVRRHALEIVANLNACESFTNITVDCPHETTEPFKKAVLLALMDYMERDNNERTNILETCAQYYENSENNDGRGATDGVSCRNGGGVPLVAVASI